MTRTSLRRRHSWPFFIACFWVPFASAAQLKESVSYIHWYATIGLAALFWPRLLGGRSRLLTYVIASTLVLSMSIAPLASSSLQSGYHLLQAGKLGIILLITVMLLSRSDTARGVLLGAEIATMVNAGMVAVGVLGVGSVFSLMSVGRYGTVLNPPGSMWRVGILVLVSSSLTLLLGKASLRPVLMLIGGLLLTVLDGSRTAAVEMAVGVGFVIYFVIREMKRSHIVFRTMSARAAVVFSIILAAFAFVPNENTYLADLGFSERGADLLSSLQGQGGSGLEDADGTRWEMITVALSEIAHHPWVGSGMGTTRIDTSVGPMVVHIAFLQVWADVGLLGFLAYTALTLGSLFGPWARPALISQAELGDRIAFHNGLFVLTCWAISGLFHPLSTELSEWIMFAVGLAGLQVPQWISRRPIFIPLTFAPLQPDHAVQRKEIP